MATPDQKIWWLGHESNIFDDSIQNMRFICWCMGKVPQSTFDFFPIKTSEKAVLHQKIIFPIYCYKKKRKIFFSQKHCYRPIKTRITKKWYNIFDNMIIIYSVMYIFLVPFSFFQSKQLFELSCWFWKLSAHVGWLSASRY